MLIKTKKLTNITTFILHQSHLIAGESYGGNLS
jgi:hypothetical protein